MQKLSNFIKDKLSFKKANLDLAQLSYALDLTSPGETTKQEHKILKGILPNRIFEKLIMNHYKL